MRDQLARLGVAFRPHVKTSKSDLTSCGARSAQTGPITVSTLKEAEYFAGFGFTDILYAVGITPNKLQHVWDLRARGVALTVILDNVEMAEALAAAATERNVSLDVMIEIDCDGHRSGVQPGSDELLHIAQRLPAAKLTLKGVITHAGSSYDCTSTAEIAAMSRQERDAAVACAQQLRRHGFDCPEVSVGSTPQRTLLMICAASPKSGQASSCSATS